MSGVPKHGDPTHYPEPEVDSVWTLLSTYRRSVAYAWVAMVPMDLVYLLESRKSHDRFQSPLKFFSCILRTVSSPASMYIVGIAHWLIKSSKVSQHTIAAAAPQFHRKWRFSPSSMAGG